ncbi:aldo/keto reductase [Sphingomonas citri]
MAQVALAWVTNRPGVSSVLLGASRPEQVRENVASLDIVLSSSQQQRLDAAGALPPLNPYFIFDLPLTSIFGGTAVRRWGEATGRSYDHTGLVA